MDCPFSGKYPSRYTSDGTEHGFYSYGIVWDYQDPVKGEGSLHVAYFVGRGEPELTCEGSFDEPPHYEPVENEFLYSRPRLKYPKRNTFQ
ncbi:hypothetical protein [Bacillus cereus group sp. TH228LC]|uniref:hypothetical protein n=2 Tax=Bacillaceae TaxID=186817 RepID=UPI0022E86FB1|nr:hypothetical protein [Bacillus cereus group sp. TH228LC]MDA1581995.1 hypothetical protein [Bacillus cereus group sp. TH228LC]